MCNKKIAVVTPGGDAPGMNACLRTIVKLANKAKYEVFGIQHGYAGLLDGDFIKLSSYSVSGIIHHGGTILKSNRCKEIKTKDGMRKAVQILKEKEISYLIIIGGDGSLTAGYYLTQKGISVLGIPASIDNDVFGTDETIGFDTALDTAVHAIDNIRDTASSFERIFVVEVMGRERGFLALDIAAASGAEIVIIPEIKINLESIIQQLKKYKQQQKKSLIIVFAEGSGNSRDFSDTISKKTGFEVRVSTLGYIQRGGEPSGRSRILALKFGNYAFELMIKNIKNRVVVIKNNKIDSIPLISIVKNKKKIDISYKKIIEKIG